MGILRRFGGLPVLQAAGFLAIAGTGALAQQPGKDPYASTYQRGHASFAIVGSRVLTGDGQDIENATVVVQDGRIVAVGKNVTAPAGLPVIDGRSKWVTPGLIDMHSHMGAMSTPATPTTGATDVVNEGSAPITAEVWVEHSIRVDDPSFARAREAGVTIVQVLPGSANLIGGRTVILKNVPSATVEGMKMPGAAQGLKMACGENPARIYGRKGRAPGTPMKSMEMYRSAFLQAQDYNRKWKDFAAGRTGEAPRRDLQMDTLAAALDGRIRVNIHCYRSDQMMQMINLSHEMGFRITTFHHAVEAYRIARELVKEGIGVAGFVSPTGGGGEKLETQGTIPEMGAFITHAGGVFAIHSDHELMVPNLASDAGRLMALSNRMGWPVSRGEAMRWLSINPARLLGIDRQTGSLAPGKDADILVWNGDPFSIYSTPEQVFIDGTKLFDRNAPSEPDSDFAIGRYRRQ